LLQDNDFQTTIISYKFHGLAPQHLIFEFPVDANFPHFENSVIRHICQWPNFRSRCSMAKSDSQPAFFFVWATSFSQSTFFLTQDANPNLSLRLAIFANVATLENWPSSNGQTRMLEGRSKKKKQKVTL